MSKKNKSDAVNESVNEQREVAKEKKSETTQAPEIKVGPTVVPRGGKKREEEQDDPGRQIESAISRTENFIYKNGKTLLGILAVVILLALGIIYYLNHHSPKQSDKAGAMLFKAEQQFSNGEYETALNGDGTSPGLLDVIEKYGSTSEGNLAKYCAGVSYYHIGDYENAIKQLKSYKQTKGAPNEIVNIYSIGLQGDAYVQLEQYEKAAKEYERAIKGNANILTTPLYLKKLALVYSKLGNHQESIEALERIVAEYPQTREAMEAELLLGAEQEKL